MAPLGNVHLSSLRISLVETPEGLVCEGFFFHGFAEVAGRCLMLHILPNDLAATLKKQRQDNKTREDPGSFFSL